MADLKVITNHAYRNHSTHLRADRYLREVREDEGSYSSNTDDLLEKMKTLLDLPLWPQFPDGVYLKPEQAERLYRLAHGMRGLVHIFNRSTHLCRIAKDYEEESNIWLNEFQESQVWSAVIELGESLVAATNELHDDCH